jgi:recombinational DNA repair ATPase RecF
LVLQRLVELNIQLFITATSPNDVDYNILQPGMMFHVEQGRVVNVV